MEATMMNHYTLFPLTSLWGFSRNGDEWLFNWLPSIFRLWTLDLNCHTLAKHLFFSDKTCFGSLITTLCILLFLDALERVYAGIFLSIVCWYNLLYWLFWDIFVWLIMAMLRCFILISDGQDYRICNTLINNVKITHAKYPHQCLHRGCTNVGDVSSMIRIM